MKTTVLWKLTLYAHFKNQVHWENLEGMGGEGGGRGDWDWEHM